MPAFLLIDLECTCDDPMFERDDMETIEIGAVLGELTDEGFLPVRQHSFYVRPLIHRQLSAFCTSLTGIEQHQVERAPTLAETWHAFVHWLGDAPVRGWGSWGKFDATQLILECRLKGLDFPLEALRHLNIKQLFARKRGHRTGLEMALQLSGLSFAGRPHCGVDDAMNIGRLLAQDALLRQAVLDRLPD
ncbi:exonuclease domain-containing protein [Thalassolituus sp. LLYu03]|uniref:exonuclease domain-containing protein n=1 Tax=Thalassolituus sp. LLYu03 TaxID=3421656 RepID=UPI003D2D6864